LFYFGGVGAGEEFVDGLGVGVCETQFLCGTHHVNFLIHILQFLNSKILKNI
jgi:hypothetical protein